MIRNTNILYYYVITYFSLLYTFVFAAEIEK